AKSAARPGNNLFEGHGQATRGPVCDLPGTGRRPAPLAGRGTDPSAAARMDGVDHFDTVRLRCDGQPIHASLTVSPIRDESGHVVGASKIARDITDRKHAEERIYRLLAELKDADRRKDEFLAMLAHELRGPLAPLSNMLEIMKRAEGDGDLRQQAR